MPSSESADPGIGNERRCPYCQQPFVPSIYRPEQSVCGQPDCQKRRKTDYHRNKRIEDPAYAQTCQNSQQNWRRDHPDYHQQYRRAHPKAVERNREGERQRYRYRQLANLAKNNLAFDLKRSSVEVWLLAPAGTVLAKNNVASSQIYIVQQLTPATAALGTLAKNT
jgi:hypothetical protein